MNQQDLASVIRAVPCSECGAPAGAQCKEVPMGGAAHGRRVLAYERQRFLAELESTLLAAERYMATLLRVNRR